MSSSVHEFGSLTLLSTAVALVYALLHVFRQVKIKALGNLPPGPVGLPIVGEHALFTVYFSFLRLTTFWKPGSLPFLSHYPELALDKWAKKFGSLYSMWLGDQLFVVLSDPQVIKDLVITNGSIFSSRKEMFMKSKIIFVRRGITATPYDETW
jgi:hypothetical protein